MRTSSFMHVCPSRAIPTVAQETAHVSPPKLSPATQPSGSTHLRSPVMTTPTPYSSQDSHSRPQSARTALPLATAILIAATTGTSLAQVIEPSSAALQAHAQITGYEGPGSCWSR